MTAALGALIGLVLALTGAGGGVLSVPLLVFGLHLPMQAAAPVGLLAVGLAAAIGAALGLREGIVRYRAASLLAGAGMLLAPLGLWCAQRLPNRPLALLFAVVLCVVSVRMLLQARRQLAGAGASEDHHARRVVCELDAATGRLVWTQPCARAITLAGMLAGFLSGLLGVGGGFVIVPALQMVSRLSMRSMIATSLAAITLVSLSGVASAAWIGVIRWDIGLPFAAGAAAGLLGGRQIAARLAGPQLQLAFAAVGLLVAGLMILRVN